MPQPQKQQQQQRGRSARKSARPLAEMRVRDKNMKMQLQLHSSCAKFDRDKSTWNRDNEKNERNILMDLAHMMDAKLTPSVDDWFSKRRIRQASCLPDVPRRRAARRGGDADDDESDESDDAESALRLQDRQRMLEAKRTDWLGVTSVPPSARPRPATAATLAATSAVAAAAAAAVAAAAAAASGAPPPDLEPVDGEEAGADDGVEVGDVAAA